MKTFKDNAGRLWTVAINVAAIKRVKTLLDVNLMDAVEGELLEKLSSDPMLLCDVLYALCMPEADKANVTDEAFGEGMSGDAIEHATTALLEELVDFFPKGRRSVLRKALEKMKAVEMRIYDYAEAKLNDPALDKEVEAVMKDISDSALNLQVLQESSHGASP